jgi:hypothetical protein
VVGEPEDHPRSLGVGFQATGAAIRPWNTIHRAGIEAAGGGQLFRGECEKVTVLVAASNAVHPVAVTARMGLVGPSLVSRTPSSRDRGGDLDASNDELVDALVRRIRAQRAPSDDDH